MSATSNYFFSVEDYEQLLASLRSCMPLKHVHNSFVNPYRCSATNPSLGEAFKKFQDDNTDRLPSDDYSCGCEGRFLANQIRCDSGLCLLCPYRYQLFSSDDLEQAADALCFYVATLRFNRVEMAVGRGTRRVRRTFADPMYRRVVADAVEKLRSRWGSEALASMLEAIFWLDPLAQLGLSIDAGDGVSLTGVANTSGTADSENHIENESPASKLILAFVFLLFEIEEFCNDSESDIDSEGSDVALRAPRAPRTRLSFCPRGLFNVCLRHDQEYPERHYDLTFVHLAAMSDASLSLERLEMAVEGYARALTGSIESSLCTSVRGGCGARGHVPTEIHFNDLAGAHAPPLGMAAQYRSETVVRFLVARRKCCLREERRNREHIFGSLRREGGGYWARKERLDDRDGFDEKKKSNSKGNEDANDIKSDRLSCCCCCCDCLPARAHLSGIDDSSRPFVDVNSAASNGMTPLHFAVRFSSHFDAAEAILLSSRLFRIFRVRDTDGNSVPIYAVNMVTAQQRIIRLLLGAGASLSIRGGPYTYTPIEYAINGIYSELGIVQEGHRPTPTLRDEGFEFQPIAAEQFLLSFLELHDTRNIAKVYVGMQENQKWILEEGILPLGRGITPEEGGHLSQTQGSVLSSEQLAIDLTHAVLSSSGFDIPIQSVAALDFRSSLPLVAFAILFLDYARNHLLKSLMDEESTNTPLLVREGHKCGANQDSHLTGSLHDSFSAQRRSAHVPTPEGLIAAGAGRPPFHHSGPQVLSLRQLEYAEFLSEVVNNGFIFAPVWWQVSSFIDARLVKKGQELMTQCESRMVGRCTRCCWLVTNRGSSANYCYPKGGGDGHTDGGACCTYRIVQSLRGFTDRFIFGKGDGVSSRLKDICRSSYPSYSRVLPTQSPEDGSTLMDYMKVLLASPPLLLELVLGAFAERSALFGGEIDFRHHWKGAV